MNKIVQLVSIALLAIVIMGCENEQDHSIILATTTSTENSGLLDYLLPYFEEEKGIEVKVVAVGTGAALEMGRMGEADILIVHDQNREMKLMDEGYGKRRSDLMFNDFVIVGTKSLGDTLESVLTNIKEQEHVFISRGDESGTHSRELSLWEMYDIENSGEWYLESGQGMGATLNMASEQQGYTLTDRSTFYFMKDELDLEVVYENKDELKNQYGVILINSEKHESINYGDAKIFYDWLISKRGQDLINKYGLEEFNDHLFEANAKG